MKNFCFITGIIFLILFFKISCVFAQGRSARSDTSKLIYPIHDSKAIQLKEHTGMDLPKPSNIQRKIEFDPINRRYVIHERIGNRSYRPTQYLTIEEYQRYENNLIKKNNWKEFSNLPLSKAREPGFIPPIVIDNKLFERLFGGTTIDIRPQVSAEVTLSGRINVNKNPLLEERQRVQGNFTFDQRMQANVVGQVGSRLRILMNYNTDAQFDFENRVKLEFVGIPTKPEFEGKDDDIIKKIEAGNVSFPLNTSLISGSQALFGLKTQLQFGRLNMTSIFSQQKSQQREITISNGSQQNEFNISASAYEANKHYFLSQYFRNHYNQYLAKIPTMTSNINITRVEVWITNKVNSTEGARDILALLDLGENTPYNTPQVQGGAGYSEYPAGFSGPGFTSKSNNLLDILPNDARFTNSNSVNTFFGSADNYGKVEYARKLRDNEFTINKQLGYISLNGSLNADEVLGVAFQYTLDGVQYQVGEFSSDIPVNGDAARKVLFVKLLKNETLKTSLPTWKLMLKNIYSLNAYQVNKSGFNLNIFRLDESSGIDKPQITEGVKASGKLWIQLTDFDRLNQQSDPRPDGAFDFLEGITIDPQNGRIVFPVLEPFGSDLGSRWFDVTEGSLKSKYVFQELYDLIQIEAQQKYPNLNRYSIRGTYQSQSGTEFLLNAINVPQGSVQVLAGTIALTEGADFTVDYNIGRVRILNQAILSSGQPIKIKLENSELFGTQQRTLIGSRFDYKVNNKLHLGGTIMNLTERPLTQKAVLGQEPIANTIWGVDVNYISKSRWLTKMVDKIPLIDTKVPSQVTFSAEYANLIPGRSQLSNGYLDDFEATRSIIDIKSFLPWQISGTPKMFMPDASLTNDLSYGYNRARIAFYMIDPIFFTSTSTTPDNIRNNKAELSNHYVRQVTDQEVFPFKQSRTGVPYPLPTLDLTFYPTVRGPYNYATTNINPDGTLQNPTNRWGGIFRKIDSSNFEALNVEFIEMWLLDPFIYNSSVAGVGGDLYFNLGNISEDILKDGRKSLENGLPIDGDPTKVDETAWGRVPKLQPVVQSFSNDPDARKFQDVGLDGLSDSDEKSKFGSFLSQITATVIAQQAINELVSDPSSDNYQYFRGTNLDDIQAGVIKRYERYNGPDGNSKTSQQSLAETGIESTASTLLPDAEDVNRDNNMTQADEYYQYKVSIRPSDLTQIGNNFITNVVPATVELADGSKSTVNWIQFKIPITAFESTEGGIVDFKSIRFCRMFMTNFSISTTLRFAKLQLVRNDWRRYNADNKVEQVIADPALGTSPLPDGSTLEVSSVSIEEHGKRSPIPYVLPPGIDREYDRNNLELNTQLNEQSIAIGVKNLKDGYSRAAFKTSLSDFRSYRRLEMFIHAEADPQALPNSLNDNDISGFIRVGADYQDNYYEYEVPLKVTPSGSTDPYVIWPDQNKLSLELEALQRAKIARNNAILNGTHSSVSVPFKVGNITIKGQPDMSRVRVFMLGIRNPLGGTDTNDKDAQVWFDELRLSDPDLRGGWAATGRLDAQLADLGRVTLSGSKSTAGFGSINNRLSERNRSENTTFDVSSNIELGKFLPDRTGIKLPMYVSYSSKVNTPQYDPRTPDLELNTVLENSPKDVQEDILFRTQDYTTNRSINFTNVRKIKTNPGSKNRLWDVENLSASYAYTEYYHRDIVTENDLQATYRAGMAYNYSNQQKMITPFEKLIKSKQLSLIRDINFSLLPSMLTFKIDIDRFYAEKTLRNNDPSNFMTMSPFFNKKFQMIRQYGFSWNLTRSAQIDFNATNNSLIDEPDGVITDEVRDIIWQNLKKFGRTTDYIHSLNFTYNLPINKLPGLDWLTIATRYGSTFNWKTEAQVTALDPPNERYGNTILNTRALQVNPTLNLIVLYNKFKFIRDVNKDSDSPWRPAVKLLTSLKNVSVSYLHSEGTVLPGFLSRPSAFFAQDFIDKPGLNFIFGGQSDIREEAARGGWITVNPLLNQQYTTTDKKELNIRGIMEPISDLRIELTALKNTNHNYYTNFKFLTASNGFESLNPVTSGNFDISFFTLWTTFNQENKFNNSSSLFRDFENNRVFISQRLGLQNPNSTGVRSDGYADGYSKNSQDVVTAAFVAAYTGRDVKSARLSSFPSFPIPNWRIRYNGLTKLEFLNQIFSSIDLTHAYSSQYTIGSFTTLARYKEENGASSVRDANNDFLPQYQFSQVAIFEKFAPLLGVNVRLKNNITFSFEYRQNRGLTFNITNAQLAVNKEGILVFGVGARTNKFRFPFGLFKGIKLDNDLNFKFDLAINDRKSIIYRTDVEDAEIASGSKNITINPSIDYVLNKQFNIRLFYSNNITKPYTSQSFYTAFSNFGISLKFNLQ